MENLVGDKIVLMPICMEDTDFIVKWRNNPLVFSNLIIRTPLRKEDHENWMLTKVATGEVVQFIIILKDSGKRVGTVYFRNIDLKNRCAEFGIFIGEDDERGKGYGTDATISIVKYGFSKLNLHRIYLRVFEHNKQAIQCYKNAGFLQEGLFRDMVLVGDEYYNIVFMSQLSV